MGIFSFVKDAGQTLARAVGLGGADVDDLTKALADNGLHIDALSLTIDKHTASIGGVAKNNAEREKAVLVIGNTKGIDTVNSTLTIPAPPPPPVAAEAAAPPPPPEPESTFHTVVSGDTLSAISKKVYGDANKYNVIFHANEPMLKHPDKIYPGQVLRCPPL
jgi:nucleoid-associated protein YgaU